MNQVSPHPARAAVAGVGTDRGTGKQRRRRRRTLLRQLLLDYAEKSTLHGPRYIIEPGLHTVEKVFWLLTFLMGLGLCAYLIREAWLKWQASPIIVSFNEKLVPVGAVAFPSLTICPAVKAKPSAYKFAEEYEKLYMYYNDMTTTKFKKPHFTNETLRAADKKLRDVSLVCRLSSHWNMFKASVSESHPTDASTVNTLLEIAPQPWDYIKQCKWAGETCLGGFATVLTEEGVCFTFNGLAAHEIFNLDNIQRDYNYSNGQMEMQDWSPSKGYVNNNKSAYPYRGMNLQHDPNLKIVFKVPKAHYDNFCNPVVRGFQVFLHPPGSHPQASMYSYSVLPGQVTEVALKFTVMNTLNSLRSYSVEIRQCYFTEEKRLRYFKVYSASNCLMECLAGYMHKKCRCVPFHMPHNANRSICTIAVQDCIRKARVDFTRKEKIATKCACYPACDDILYEAELLRTDFDSERYVNYTSRVDKRRMKATKYQNHEGMEYSILSVFYRDSRYMSIMRSELYGVTEFLANCGGLMGLCLGFSLLSVIEIVYFLTLRLGCVFRQDIEQEKTTLKKKTPEDCSPRDVQVDKQSITTLAIVN